MQHELPAARRFARAGGGYPTWVSERAERRGAAPEPEDVGAGTGATARDAGEEGTPAGAIGETGAFSDTDSEWTALAGETPSEEGAAAGGLRDEGTEDDAA